MPTAQQRNIASLQSTTSLVDTFTAAINTEVDIPDIVTFAEHEDFLGKRLYPRQKTLLRLIYLDTEHMTAYDEDVINGWAQSFYNGINRIGVPPDIWKRVEWLKSHGYPHFREILNIIGRRGSKGYLGAICLAYQNWKLIQLDNPQWYYGIDSGKEVYSFISATSEQQAIQYQFADFANVVLQAKCFQPYIATAKEYAIAFRTPADIRRIAEFEARKLKPERLIASLRNVAISSNSKSARGAASFACVFDELAHMQVGSSGPRTGDELYNAVTPSLDQMGKDAFIYAPSSPYTKTGILWSLYESGLQVSETNEPLYPSMLVVQLPSWSLFEGWSDKTITGGVEFRGAPQLYDEHMQQLERRDPDVFKVERLSQWAAVVDAYLNPELVDRMFAPFKDELGQQRTLQPQDHGVFKFIYRGHCDPSKAGANTAAVVAHCEQLPDETGEHWFHVIVDKILVFKPENYEDHQIDYSAVEDELFAVIQRFPTMKVFSYDQYGSFVTVPRLRKRLKEANSKTLVREETFTEKSNQRRCERFKAALGMNWIHSIRDNYGNDGGSLLSDECKFLQLKNQKVVKQDIGPVRTKDVFDALACCVDELLEDNFRRLQKRDELGELQMLAGSEGGYLSRNMGEEESSIARTRLRGHSQASVRRQLENMGRFRKP